MQAEVIAIGDELTSGQRLDTNSQWISQRLGELGISTIRHTTVGDDLAENIEALRLAVHRADVVICSGGLGPTLDDLTRQAIADAFDCPLILDEASLAHIRGMFASRRREMPERNRDQAMFPAGCQVIPNPHGSAPGFDLVVPRGSTTPSDWPSRPSKGIGAPSSRVFALPGVPAELRQMWLETVVGRLETMLGSGQGPLRYYALKVFGIGESDVEVKLPDLIDRRRAPTVGITVSRATITLRIACRARDEAEFQRVISPTIEEIRQALGDLVFGQGEEELEHVVLRALQARGQTISCVEVGAASWLNDWLLQATGAPQDAPAPLASPLQNFAGGIAVPSPTQARRWLVADTDPTGELWGALAQQARARFSTDVGLVVGVYPTQQAMEQTNSAFDFHFAIAYGDQTHIEQRAMGGHPDVLGPRVAKTALDMVRRILMHER